MRRFIVTILRMIYSHIGNDLAHRYIIKLIAVFDRGGTIILQQSENCLVNIMVLISE